MSQPSKARERAELLPCPFCGGEAILTEIPAHTHKIATFMPDHSGSAMVECGGCSCGMIADNAAAVIEAWSARAPVTCPDTAGGDADESWLIRKSGYFYRPNCKGYTISIYEAGLYTKDDAQREAKIEDNITAHPLSEFRTLAEVDVTNVKRIISFLDASAVRNPKTGSGG